MKKLIVYGLGNSWNNLKNHIDLHYQIYGYTDITIKKTYGKFIIPADLIYKINDVDYILITTTKYKDSILSDLAKFGIPREKILCGINELSMKEIDEILTDEEFAYETGNSSITDSDKQYRKAIRAALLSDTFFEHFRSNSIFMSVYESLSIAKGKLCIDEIEKKQSFPRDMVPDFIRNDDIGDPDKFEFTLYGSKIYASPSTLRYMKILGDLIEYFDISKMERIAEIGIGYGGQGRILAAFLGNMLKEYFLIDLPDVLQLSLKYLRALNAEKRFTCIDGTKLIPEKEYDLVISNYAFSELSREVQDKYLRNIIDHAKHGYIIWNSLSYELLDGYSVMDLLAKIPNSRVEEEIPLTYEKNCIIVW